MKIMEDGRDSAFGTQANDPGAGAVESAAEFKDVDLLSPRPTPAPPAPAPPAAGGKSPNPGVAANSTFSPFHAYDDLLV